MSGIVSRAASEAVRDSRVETECGRSKRSGLAKRATGGRSRAGGRDSDSARRRRGVGVNASDADNRTLGVQTDSETRRRRSNSFDAARAATRLRLRCVRQSCCNAGATHDMDMARRPTVRRWNSSFWRRRARRLRRVSASSQSADAHKEHSERAEGDDGRQPDTEADAELGAVGQAAARRRAASAGVGCGDDLTVRAEPDAATSALPSQRPRARRSRQSHAGLGTSASLAH